MEITLNGEKETLDQEYSVTGLVKKLELSPEIVTVSLNGTILSREIFDNTLVNSFS